MKLLKILISGIIILNFSTLSAQEKKVFLFPIVSETSASELSFKYTDLLKEKLIKAGAFEVEIIRDFKYELKENDTPYISVKNAVLEVCLQKNIQSAIYGYIIKKENWYDLKVFFHSVSNDDIVSEYSDILHNEAGVERLAVNSAVEFVSDYHAVKGLRIFVGSALMPGLGQLFMKDYLKSALFFGGIGYILYKYSKAGSPKSLENDAEIRVVESNSIRKYIYLFKGEEVSYEFLKSLPSEYHKYNQELSGRKTNYQLAAAAVYLLNIFDILRSIKSYNDRQRLRNRLTFDAGGFGENPRISLVYSF
ncbi:hypothetical protein ACFL4T_03705 [candidate division KSB1 bacterium]